VLLFLFGVEFAPKVDFLLGGCIIVVELVLVAELLAIVDCDRTVGNSKDIGSNSLVFCRLSLYKQNIRKHLRNVGIATEGGNTKNEMEYRAQGNIFLPFK